MPAALELDGGQVMAVIEAVGNQKQGIQVGAAIELMVFDQVLQFPVLLGTAVRGQPFEQRRNRQLFVVGHGDAELCGQVFQTRSEEHTSDLPSLMRISYAVLCLKQTNNYTHLSQSSVNYM